MPELPEVETIVRELARTLPGQRILQAKVFRPDVLREPPHIFCRAVAGAEIQSVNRRGKNIVLSLSPSRILVVNLGMTGRLLHLPPSHQVAPYPHRAVDFLLHSGGALLYTDSRRFGRAALFSEEEWERESERLGPEPLSPDLTVQAFHRRLTRSRAPVRSWLLDQTHLAGIGNIYACEALHRAGIHPLRKASSLALSQSGRLLRALRDVLTEALEARGTSLRDYRTATGEEGGFLTSLRVYGREGRPCVRCTTSIARIVLSNRSAFFCPRCQPETSSWRP